MSTLQLYYDLLSQPSRSLYIILKKNNIPFEPCPVALKKREHLTDEFKETLNRFQKVPFIHHGEFKLSESVAIVSYLSREFRELVPENWYPTNSKNLARVEEYLAWQHINLRIPCATYFWYKWMIPRITKSEPDEATITMHKNNMITGLDQLQELWLSQGHSYIAGDQISVADVFAACELEQPRIGGYDPTETRPVLKKWLDSVRNDCAPFYDEAHVILNKVVAQSKAKL